MQGTLLTCQMDEHPQTSATQQLFKLYMGMIDGGPLFSRNYLAADKELSAITIVNNCFRPAELAEDKGLLF